MIVVGSEVGWAWLNGIATGTVVEIHPERWDIITKGKHIVRNGSPDDPVLVIKNDKDVLILKLQHEVQLLSGTS